MKRTSLLQIELVRGTKILPFLCVLLLLSSCLETSSDASDEEPAGDCSLTTSTTTLTHASGSRFSYTLNYTYAPTGQLETIAAADTSAFLIKFKYDEQRRLVQESFHDYSWVSEYNSAGQLVRQTRTFRFAPERYETQYLQHTYTTAGELQQTDVYVVEEQGDVPVYRYLYTYTDGRLTGIEKISLQDQRKYRATILTDDKKVPLPVMPMHLLYQFRDEPLPVLGLLNHNVVSYTVQQGEESSEFKSFTAAYTYNSAGYPLTLTRTYANGSVEETRYYYTCK